MQEHLSVMKMRQRKEPRVALASCRCEISGLRLLGMSIP